MILDRIVEVVDTERFKHITDSALEGLAKRELNLSVIVGKREEAKERRLVPEVIEDFFVQSGCSMRAPPEGDIQRFAYVSRGENSEKSAACWREA